MPKKPYARTFRYSEETRKILDQYYGDFDSLVHYSYFRAAEVNNQIDELLKRKESLEKEISYLYNKRFVLMDILSNLEAFKGSLISLEVQVNKFNKM